jgi:hypothetical protein
MLLFLAFLWFVWHVYAHVRFWLCVWRFYLLLTRHALLQGFHCGVTCPCLQKWQDVLPWAQFGGNFFMKTCWLISHLSVQVIIEGFKSYREISTEPFSPKVNVVGKPLLLFPRSLGWLVSRLLLPNSCTDNVAHAAISAYIGPAIDKSLHSWLTAKL